MMMQYPQPPGNLHMTKEANYRKDILGDLDKQHNAATPLIPAATVVLLRTHEQTIQVLMLQKNTGIAFGGMWVFPGGKIDACDYPDCGDIQQAAQNAAVRETQEETGINLNPDDFVLFSHWTPPPSTPKRYSTWFFAAETDFKDKVIVDGGEILNHRWITPQEALQRHNAGDIELAPPTWITLYQLSLRDSIPDLVELFESRPPTEFATHLKKNSEGTPVAIWFGDAAYENGDLSLPGERHRLTLSKGGFKFENTVMRY